MTDVSIVVDGREIRARSGERLLFRALDEGFDIPALCAIRGLEPPQGSCRLCFVEVEGLARPVTSCTIPVKDGMIVRTRSAAVDRLVRSGFELLMSTHRVACGSCPANRRCALQQIARSRRMPLRSARVPRLEPTDPVDESRPEIGFDPSRCILCGRCVHACGPSGGRAILSFVHRSIATRVGTFDGRPLAEQDCGRCTDCVDVCPVGALYRRGN